MTGKNQNGAAMFAAMAILSLCTGLALLAFQVATTELQISGYEREELAAFYLAESGIEQVRSWISHPERSYDPDFFSSVGTRSCSQEREHPDSRIPPSWREEGASGRFSELTEMGSLLDLRLYRPLHPSGLCTVESSAKGPKGAVRTIKVEIGKNPMKPISAGIQGEGGTGFEAPTWVHWGKIRYTGDADLGKNLARIPRKNDFSFPDFAPYLENGPNEDPLLEIHVEGRIESFEVQEGRKVAGRPNLVQSHPVLLDEMNEKERADLKSYARKYGSYYVVSPSGELERNGVRAGTFDEVFGAREGGSGLVWIDIVPDYSRADPLAIEGGDYKGYFYFAGDIRISGNRPGRRINAFPHPWASTFPDPILLSDINLEGFFYAFGRVDLLDSFSAFGAFYAGRGLIGPGAPRLQVWYNAEFQSAAYKGVPAFVRLSGTWKESFSHSGM